jgi:hypothetical protein
VRTYRLWTRRDATPQHGQSDAALTVAAATVIKSAAASYAAARITDARLMALFRNAPSRMTRILVTDAVPRGRTRSLPEKEHPRLSFSTVPCRSIARLLLHRASKQLSSTLAGLQRSAGATTRNSQREHETSEGTDGRFGMES